jgi:ceramide glucosyltransferase
MDSAIQVLEAVAVLGTLCACGYYVLCLWAARSFRRDTAAAGPDASFLPPVSILKPLRGADAGIYECFRDHCRQDYPEYELIFGVSDPKDPAVELVERLQEEFPGRSIRLLVCPKVLGTNLKVSNLAQMLPLARYDYLIVNDSDVGVAPDYLRRVVAPLRDSNVGLVTCLYRGVGSRTLGARLEALGISTDFAAGVLAARQIEGVRFGLGSTLAFSRRALEVLGGFEPLVDYLADDYELGCRMARRGFEVRLSEVVVDDHLPDYTLGGFLEHQLRWARGIRDSRRWGYTGMVLTFGIPWAIAALLLSRGAAWAWGLLAVTMALRLTMALVVGSGVLRDRGVPRWLWLVPPRDLLAVLIWAASYAGHTVAWRGDQFILEKGKLRAAEQPGPLPEDCGKTQKSRFLAG